MPAEPIDTFFERNVAIVPLRGDAFDLEFHHNLLFGFDGEQILSHYIPLKFFKVMLEASALRLKRLDLYDDQYEGRFPAANRTQEATVSARLTSDLNITHDADAIINSQEIARQYCYIHCWFGRDKESRPMWHRYGDGGRGVCIRSSTSRIKQSVSSPGAQLHLHLGRVTYSEEATPIGTLISLAPAFRKHPDKSDEAEFRPLSRMARAHHPTDADGHLVPAPEFQVVPVSLTDLVAEILIGPHCQIEQIEEIFELGRHHLPEVPVKCSELWRP